ncbi:prepilin peptidase [Anaeromyxobacter diazotrophicus]|uniref:Prepilin leader peptidase/N-methyltransferase n=1 Tax=Anaeromyxobacter diazotrophicus TaxID=2590199 RepID=A0A7I9VGY8_9BACT|nr:A24 family peptidase [Anaeromyxobacter diazotrophicus]GEJ55654.1 hypothetical protein AMYX_03950 [Anaeromyxobacter diazotrophicus]
MTPELGPALGALVAVWVALLGAVVGSFLNVVIARVPAGESIVYPGSRCPRCRTPIRWYDNLPIVSWLALRARCRACGARISARYPAVEALGAAAALVIYARHGLSGAAAVELAFVAALLALAFIDVDTWLLPNVLTWAVLAFGILVAPLGITPATTLRHALYGAGLGFAAFALLGWLGERLLKKEALGFGDVWLLAGLGAWFGPLPLLPVVLLASVQGSVVGLALLAMGKGEPGPAAPLPGPLPPPPPLLPGDGGEAPGEPTADAAPAAQEQEQEQAGAGAAPASEQDWVPPKHAVPFGPFLVAGALEWLWLAGLLARAFPVLRLFG